VLLISTAASGSPVDRHRAAIDAARAAGVSRIAYTSVTQPVADNPALVVLAKGQLLMAISTLSILASAEAGSNQGRARAARSWRRISAMVSSSPRGGRSGALKDVTAVGILSASPGLDDAIATYASGAVDPRPLVAATVGLDQVAAVLAGERIEDAGAGPKIHVDPRIL
jgi:hypothetical protein